MISGTLFYGVRKKTQKLQLKHEIKLNSKTKKNKFKRLMLLGF